MDSWVDAGGPDAVELLMLDTAHLAWPAKPSGSPSTPRPRVLFALDPPARVAWEATIRRIYLDKLPRRDRAGRDFVQARRGG